MGVQWGSGSSVCQLSVILIPIACRPRDARSLYHACMHLVAQAVVSRTCHEILACIYASTDDLNAGAALFSAAPQSARPRILGMQAGMPCLSAYIYAITRDLERAPATMRLC